MSELEIQKRQAYKQNRKKWTMIQLVAILVMAAIALTTFLIYNSMNRTYYVEYTETSSLKYKVYYKENTFFESEYLGENHEYISELTRSVLAEFYYKANIGDSDVGFDYRYKIDAILKVSDRDSGNDYYTVEESILPLVTMGTRRTAAREVNEVVTIDYNKYNEIAHSFVKTYDLKNATSSLIVTLSVDVLSSAEVFEEAGQQSFVTSIVIPLNEDTFAIKTTASAPEAEGKMLAYKGAEGRKAFHVISIIAMILTALQAIGVLVYLHLTKNEDITYETRVKRLLGAYSSYIQRVEGEFDLSRYQVLSVRTFNELLGIRDTLQAPIIMTENKDKTMTRFLVLTDGKLVYVHEIKVDNYDAIYSRNQDDATESETV